MINREEGCAGFRYAYDTLGNWTDTWYVSPEGEDQVMVQESYVLAYTSPTFFRNGRTTKNMTAIYAIANPTE